jgi:hypothetical protein
MDLYSLIVAAVLVLALLTMLGGLLWLRRRNRRVPDSAALWQGLDRRCPDCGGEMEEGWVMLGKGAIWSPRARGRPGTFAHIGQALPNTISLDLKPAANMGWRCEDCRLLLVDYDKLVG